MLLAGVFIAGTAFGTRGKLLPILLGVVIAVLGIYTMVNGEKAFIDISNSIKFIKSITDT